jgi:isoprenylcysteine carboxyl methyltransferase (ICMT) family protein YpbQ
VGWFDALIGLPVILGLFFGLRILPETELSNPLFVALLVAGLGLVMGTIEIYRAPWRHMQRSHDPLSDIISRTCVKLLGFFAALAGIIFLYWLFPEYHRDYYNNYFSAAISLLPYLPLVVVPYFFYVEWRLPREYGGAWEAAMFVMGKWDRIDWHVFSQYALSWLVKGYFLPIMFGDVANNIGYLRLADWNIFSQSFVPAFELLFMGLIHLELIFVAAGYVFTCRLFDSHIRAVEKTLFGWVVAVVSYSPLLSLVYVRYFGYNTDSINWLSWLADYPALIVAWGSIILALVFLHLWCDACFGVRFSNLTHRGVITNGPYRFSKHPAYVIKNIRWWMVSVPFIALAWDEAIRFSLLLICVNLLYTLRGYAEERMLSQDPTYVAYARWMDRHGALRFLGRWFPILSYEWRLARWREKGLISTPQ